MGASRSGLRRCAVPPCCPSTMPAGARRRRTYVGWRWAPPTGAPASASWRSTRSCEGVAPRVSPCARADTRRWWWAGCTPTTRTALTPWPTAAPAAAPPLCPHRGRPRRGRSRRPAHRRRPARSRCRAGATLDPRAAGRLGARAVRPDLLPRDDPRRPAPLGPELEEGQEAARPRRPGAAASVRWALRRVLADAQRARHLLVYLDEAHIYQDADLGYGRAERGRRLCVASGSP